MRTSAFSTLKSQGKNTPFQAMELAGKLKFALMEGYVVYEG